jgi:sulfur carrier protein
VRIQVNGEARAVPDSLTLLELVTHLQLSLERLAIELNQEVARRAEWSNIILQEDDRVEIVHFVGGGGAPTK